MGLRREHQPIGAHRWPSVESLFDEREMLKQQWAVEYTAEMREQTGQKVGRTVTIVGAPKSFPKMQHRPAGSQRVFRLALFFRYLVVGAVGLEPTTR